MKNKAASYDADVYIFFKAIVIKKYKKNEPQIIFLNEYLKKYYKRKYRFIMPVAAHEWTALKIINRQGYAPKPLFLGKDFIVMEYAGENIEGIKNIKSYNLKQAKEILQIFKNINFKHNDLLPRNICIKNGKLKIIDFTMAEFNDIEIIKKLPNSRWAYPGDERIISYFKEEK